MEDICPQILKYLPFNTIYICTQVCKAFNVAFHNKLLWKDLYQTNFGNYDVLINNYAITCKLYYIITEYRCQKSRYVINTYISNIGINFCNSDLNIIPTEFGLLVNLQKIVLNKHNISVIPTEICRLPNLTTINVSDNRIKIIPTEIHNLTSLEKLDICKNKIKNMPIELYAMTQLVELDFSNNKISLLPTEIGLLTNLLELDISNNKLSSIPTEIKLLNLNVFYSFNNKINN